MLTDKDKIIDRIKKLIALSEDLSTSDHERTSARKKAHSLMVKFSIDNIIGDSTQNEIVHREFALSRPVFGLDSWKQCQILSAVGPPLGCYAYYKKSEDKVYVMGFSINCEIAIYTAHVLINQGKISLRSLWNNSPSANTKMAFWKGFVSGLYERYTIKPTEENGLIIYDKVKDLFDKITVVRSNMFSGGSSLGALIEGAKSAKDARVSMGVESEGHEQRRIG